MEWPIFVLSDLLDWGRSSTRIWSSLIYWSPSRPLQEFRLKPQTVLTSFRFCLAKRDLNYKNFNVTSASFNVFRQCSMFGKILARSGLSLSLCTQIGLFHFVSVCKNLRLSCGQNSTSNICTNFHI